MGRTVAVITDAASSGYFFPLWHRYYGQAFGAANLYVVAYRKFEASFEKFELGALIVEDESYEEAQRAAKISEYVNRLLGRYNLVLRCDVDEFLVPDPARATSLRNYIDALELPYVTAIGLDLFEARDEAALDFDQPILPQRPWCVETASLSKTAVISRDAGAVRWAEGFHAANVPPRFDQLYLVHTKFADVQGRIEWFTHMRDAVPADSRAYQYYDEGKAKIEGFASHMNRLPRSSGCGVSSNDAFRDGFLRTVQQNPVNGIWQGEFRVDTKARHHGLIGF